MEQLFLEDLNKMTDEEIRLHLEEEYKVSSEELSNYHILIAYESVGSWGCDSSSFFLLKHKDSQELFEVNASHCSCYGFEDQFEPEETTIEYLKSNSFCLSCGGYDDNYRENRQKVQDFILKL